VAVLTEAQLPFAGELYEHVVDAGPHPKARHPEGSKVIVASKHRLDVVDLVGSEELPPRNFVAVDVVPSGGDPLRVIGVVIRYNQKREYIEALPPVLARLVTDRTVFAGDFNLRMLKPHALERTLTATLVEAGLTVATAGPWPELADEWPLIDHIAVSSALPVSDMRVWGRHVAGEDRRIADHAGVSLTIGS
jgi:endonuclease/exonuclease/phosphatase family metal-dependent hydrolase